MNDRTLRWISRILLATALVLVGTSAAAEVVRGSSFVALVRDYSVLGWVMATTFPAMGALIIAHQPRHPVGWIHLLIGVGMLSGIATQYAEWGLADPAGAAHLAVLASWIGGWWWVPSVGLFLTFALLLFPDGRLPSPRWRPVAWAAATGIVLVTLDFALGSWSVRGPQIVEAGDVDVGSGLPPVLAGSAEALLFGAALLSIASLFVRLRGARGELRQQLKWVVFASAVAVLAMVVTLSTTTAGQDTGAPAMVLVAPLVPVATGIAIVRFRLYDIDLVVNKAVLFGLLAGFVTAVYVGIVVGAGALAGATADEPNVGLSLLATAVVAAAFQPARQRARRVANRLVYGHRANPYEVVADFSARMAEAVATDEVLPRMAEAACQGIGAAAVTISVALPTRGVQRFSWPEAAPAGTPPDHVVPVDDQGERIGEIAVHVRPGERLSADDLQLVEDLAAQAGLALHAVGLNAELRARGDEIAVQAAAIRASRQRIVAAQDAERRRMERDIHDGAQQQLVAMSVKIGLAAQLLDRDPDRAVAILDQLGQDANEALEGLRDLARGIFPPLLVEQGIVAALDAHVRKHALPVTILTDPGAAAGRFGQDVEVAVYFCCLEAIANATKHAPRAPVTVRLSLQDGALRFSVADEGPGFDPTTTPRGSGLQNMADRIAALRGQLAVDGVPGAGVTVTGCIPLATPATPAPTPAA